MKLLNNFSDLLYFDKKLESKKLELYLEICNKTKLLNKKHFNKVKNPKISIISPTYNREKYLLRFLRSIQNQYFDDIEIIFVDDFSKDNSVKLIQKFQKEDERIILIKHNKNKGTLISRNDGVIKAKGEYIMLPDPDDILSENILKICYNLANEYKIEMIRYNVYIGNNTLLFENIVSQLKSIPIFQPELSTYLFYAKGTLQQIDFNVANKFIKREAFIRTIQKLNTFYYNQYMIDQEDGLINYLLYRTANSFIFLKKIGYYYLPNDQSITKVYYKNYEEILRNIFLLLRLVFENTKSNKYEKDMMNSLFGRLYQGVLGKCLHLITKDFSFYIEILNMYLKCKFITKKNIGGLKKLKKIIIKKLANQ